MKHNFSFSNSSVGKKILMGVSGLFLCSFLLVHLSGNFLLFKNDGGKAFDEYAHFMSTNGITRIMEIVLVVGFVFHIVTGTKLWLKNRQARKTKYQSYQLKENTQLASRFSMLSGSIVFFFLVVHLKSFWFDGRIMGTPSMYQLVAQSFSNVFYSGFYLVALVLLAYHLKHGFQAAFQSLGLRQKKYIGLLDTIALIFWLLIPLGFATMPIYFLLFYKSVV